MDQVGDKYCKQEYLKLKRSIRNRIKDKLCVGCYQVDLDGQRVQMPRPDKLSANYWETNFHHDPRPNDEQNLDESV